MTLENVSLKFRLGDTWSSPVWAVLVDDLPVNLAADGWSVRCQARRTPDSPLIQEWATTDGGIVLGTVTVSYGSAGLSGETSTVQLRHTASQSDGWEPFAASFEIEIERGTADSVERHTVVSGRISAIQDITDF